MNAPQPGRLKFKAKTDLKPISGAPVVNEYGAVIAIISVSQDEGQRELAISIEALRHIWRDMPADLLASPKFARIFYTN